MKFSGYDVRELQTFSCIDVLSQSLNFLCETWVFLFAKEIPIIQMWNIWYYVGIRLLE